MLKRLSSFFFIGSFLAFLFLFILLSVLGKDDAFFFIHHKRLSILDETMPTLTYLGDGLFAVLVFPFLFFRNRKAAWHLLISGGIVLAIVQVLKLYIFVDATRPIANFEAGRLYILSGVEMHSGNSFPSGHTASAFMLFGVLSYYLKQRAPQILLLLLASIAAWSRIYLGQHFVGDVATGILIGVAGAWAGHILLHRYQ